MTRIVLSAHLDDGVLSASHVPAQPGSSLVTVIGGVPPRTHPWNDLLDHEAWWQPNREEQEDW